MDTLDNESVFIDKKTGDLCLYTCFICGDIEKQTTKDRIGFYFLATPEGILLDFSRNDFKLIGDL